MSDAANHLSVATVDEILAELKRREIGVMLFREEATGEDAIELEIRPPFGEYNVVIRKRTK